MCRPNRLEDMMLLFPAGPGRCSEESRAQALIFAQCFDIHRSIAQDLRSAPACTEGGNRREAHVSAHATLLALRILLRL